MATNDHGHCPNCGVSLTGGSIWQHFRDKYGTDRQADETAELYGATREVGTWGRAIDIYDMATDRSCWSYCPDCDHEWNRK